MTTLPLVKLIVPSDTVILLPILTPPMVEDVAALIENLLSLLILKPVLALYVLSVSFDADVTF